MNNIAVQEPFLLGQWRVDPGLCEISSEAGTVHVEPRTMAVLCFLAARAQQTVSRDELLDALWKTRFVVEDALTRCISQLRRHLDDDPRNPRFIQTVPKVGYRLLVSPELMASAAPTAPPPAEVEAPSAPQVTPQPASTPTPTPTPWRSRRAVMALASFLLLATAIAWWRFGADDQPDAARAERSIAILPFVVLGDSADARTFADGMTEDLIQLLATVPDMRVASRTSSYYFKDKSADLATIARALGVAYVLEGSVRREGDRILVKAQLIDADTDQHIWSQEFDRELRDLFELQQQIAVAVAQRLDLSVGAGVLGRGPATRNMAAYQLFVEGRMALGIYEQGAAKESIAMLEAAVNLDPQFAVAWSSLAVARWVSPASTQMTPAEILASDEAARAAARRALTLDANSPNAQFVLADSARVGYAFAEAETRYRAALAQAPGHTSLQIGYGTLLGDVGRVRDSLARRELSFRLDPLSPVSAFFLARGAVLAGNIAEGRRHLVRARELGFRNAVLDHAEAYLAIRERNFAAARAIWSRHDTSESRVMQVVIAEIEDPTKRADATAKIRELPPWNVLPYRGRMFAALLLGETEIAWQAAEEGVAQKLEPTDIWWLPEAAPLRKDPRFAALSERMNLVQYWRQYGWPDACLRSEAQLVCD